MKTGLFILNVVSVSLLIVMAASNPSVVGAAVTLTDAKEVIVSPMGFANIFIILTITLDIIFYMKSRKNR